MDKNINKHIKDLYNVQLIKENKLGLSGNTIFEVGSKENEFILRISEYEDFKVRHLDFELKWMNYLADSISAITRPIKSNKGAGPLLKKVKKREQSLRKNILLLI